MTVIYQNINNREHYWNGGGWSDRFSGARKFRTLSEAEPIVRRMMIDNVKAKTRTYR